MESIVTLISREAIAELMETTPFSIQSMLEEIKHRQNKDMKIQQLKQFNDKE